ncbi:hypothetical protein ACP70R_042181 [Stipagrostis hirtigluma subsp. patula]
MDRLHRYEARFCPPQITAYIANLTSSYTDKSNEPTMVSSSVIMFVLAGLFFNLNLFSGISDVSATLDPKVRLFLTSALSLFLPVMSYLFSEAKNAAGSSADDLSLGAGLILAWMLLVELIRKKVDEIRMRGFSGTIQRAGRVAWLGNLVFFNIRTAGRKALFGILWVLCATRVVQRIAYTELGKRSYAHGKNARLVSSYMAKMLAQDHRQRASSARSSGEQEALMKSCKYIVMGEEKLVTMPAADGYELNMADVGSVVVTVGRVWEELDDRDKLFASPEQSQRSKRLCLSFALFKLLRRRFEKLPAVTDEEARNCRDLILNGLFNHDADTAEKVFQLITDEVNFLSEYYHSVVPVVLASPFFLLANYFLVLIVVAALCAMTVILCGNGDVIYAYRSIRADNYALQSGLGNMAMCLFIKATNSPTAFFSIVDLSITVLLFIIYFYEEIWEFFVFLLSNWFMVSLLYNFTAKPHWREIPAIRLAFRRITWARSMISHGNLSFRQFSALNLRWPLKIPLYPTLLSLALRKDLVPVNLKHSIIQYLVEHDRGSAGYTPLTNGKSALRRNNLFDQLSWACESDSVAEVILTWHIATGILEVKRPPQSTQLEEASWSRVSAIRLSQYCAYLVAFHPELLPGNPEKAEIVVEAMKEELRAVLGRVDYYLSPQVARVQKIMDVAADRNETTLTIDQVGAGDQSSWGGQIGVVRNGAKLGKWLVGEAERNGSAGAVDVWKVLADVWTELIVFVAPSAGGDGEESVRKGHEDVLVQGGEFITVLWALATHLGVSRQPAAVGSTATDDGVSRPAEASTAAGGESPSLRDLLDASMRARRSAAS